MAASTTVIEVITTLEDKTQAGASSAVNNVSKIEKAMKKAQKEIEKLKKMSGIEMTVYAADKASKVLNGVLNTGKKLTGKVFKVTVKAVDLVTAPFKGIMKMVTNPIVAAAGIAGVSIGIADVVNTYKDFEQGMANVKAITGATDESMIRLTETAKKLGEETMFSAKQVAGGMEFLAMAGWKTNDIIKGMPGLLNLAAAGGVDVAMAADVVSSALAQFNMKAEESNRVADVLAATATNSKTDITGLGESLKYAGSMAGNLKYSIEDTALALGLMGTRGTDGSMAGTSLRALISRMAGEGEIDPNETKEVAGAMNKLGVSLYDTTGKAKPLIEVMRELRKGYKKLKESEKSGVAKTLAGAEGQAGLLAIVETSEKDFNELAEAIQNSKGAAEKMSKIRMETLQGSMYKLQSAADGVKLAFMEELAPYLKTFIDWLTSKMPDLKNAAVDFADSIAKTIESVTKSVEDMVNSPEWENAETLWDKIKVAWNKLIAEPFDNWWNGTGKSWLADKAKGIGEGLGKAITFGFTALFGGDTDGIMKDGASIGSTFGEGFAKGFDGGKVAEAIKNALSSALKLVFSNSVTGSLAKAWIGGKLLGAGSKIYGMVKPAKELFNSLFASGMSTAATTAAATNGAGLFGGFARGLAIRKAAKEGGPVEDLILAQSGKNGKLGFSTQLGSAGPLKGGLAVGGGIYAGTTLISGASDIVTGFTADDSRIAKANIISGVVKTGGVAAGAAIGASIGSVVPIVGTLIGAGIGAIVGSVVGDSIKENAEEEVSEEQAKALAEARAKKASEYKSKDLQSAILNGVSEDELNEKFKSIVQDRLKKAFGNIELSASEIEVLAKKIPLGGAVESMDTFSKAVIEADNDLSNLENTAADLKKINWKASLGVKWNKDDSDEFIMTVNNMIEQSKDYITDTNYEVDAAVNLLFGENDETGKNITKGLDALFLDFQKQIDENAKQIQIILDDDNILSVDKPKMISKYMEEINQVTNKINEARSKGEVEAGFDLLKAKYGGDGSKMSIKSYSEMRPKLYENRDADIEQADKAYKESVSMIRTEIKLNPEFKEEGEKQIAEATQRYKDRVYEIVNNVFSYDAQTAAGVLTGKHSPVSEAVINKLLPEGFEGTAEERTQAVAKTLMSKIQTTLSLALKEGVDVSKITPEQWIEIFGLKGAFGGDKEGMESFGEIVLPMVQGLNENFIEKYKPEAETTANLSRSLTDTALAKAFGTPIDKTVRVNVTPEIKIAGIVSAVGGGEFNVGQNVMKTTVRVTKVENSSTEPTAEELPAKAEGDILNSPQLALVAEDGPEAIIPLSEKRRNRGVSLWEKAGRLLGKLPKHAEGGIFGITNDVDEDDDETETKKQIKDTENKNTLFPAPVSIDLGGINITINSSDIKGDNSDIVEVIRRNIPEIADEAAAVIAKELLKLFANMKGGIITV